MWGKIFILISGLAMRRKDRCELGNNVIFILSFLDLPYKPWQSLQESVKPSYLLISDDCFGWFLKCLSLFGASQSVGYKLEENFFEGQFCVFICLGGFSVAEEELYVLARVQAAAEHYLGGGQWVDAETHHPGVGSK